MKILCFFVIPRIIIKVASSALHSADLERVATTEIHEPYDWCEDGNSEGLGFVSINATFAPEFLIDWCALKLVRDCYSIIYFTLFILVHSVIKLH